MISKPSIRSRLAISLATLAMSSVLCVAQDGFYKETYEAAMADLTPEQKDICAKFTEWAIIDPSSTVSQYLLAKSMRTLGCGERLLSGRFEPWEEKYKGNFLTDMKFEAQARDLADQTRDYQQVVIPTYFSQRLSYSDCGKPAAVDKTYTAKGRVGALSQNKFKAASAATIKLTHDKSLEIEEILSGSIFGTPTKRRFVLSPNYIRLESQWASSLPNQSKTTPISTLSDDGRQNVTFSNKAGKRYLTGSGVIHREVIGCLTQPSGRYSQLTRVDQPEISPNLAANSIRNPDTPYSPIFLRTYLYETDIESGKIIAFAEIDFVGENLHILDPN